MGAGAAHAVPLRVVCGRFGALSGSNMDAPQPCGGGYLPNLGRLNCISEVTALLRIKEIKTAGAGIDFPGQLRRLVRPVRPGRVPTAAQVGWKAHLDGI